MPDTIPQIYSLISKVMGEIGAVGKDSKNEAQGYKFRGIDAMLNAAHPALVKHGVFCVPQVVSSETSERVSAPDQYGKVKVSFRVTTVMKYLFYAPDGSFVEVVIPGEGIDTSDKATNKSMSAAMKYALIQLFSIPTEDMDDADKTTPETGPATLPVGAKPRVYTRNPATSRAGEAAGEIKGPAASHYIDKGKGVALHRAFREALMPSIQKDADAHLKAILQSLKIVNEQGQPSTLMIRNDSYDDVKMAVMEYAKKVNYQSEEQ